MLTYNSVGKRLVWWSGGTWNGELPGSIPHWLKLKEATFKFKCIQQISDYIFMSNTDMGVRRNLHMTTPVLPATFVKLS